MQVQAQEAWPDEVIPQHEAANVPVSSSQWDFEGGLVKGFPDPTKENGQCACLCCEFIRELSLLLLSLKHAQGLRQASLTACPPRILAFGSGMVHGAVLRICGGRVFYSVSAVYVRNQNRNARCTALARTHSTLPDVYGNHGRVGGYFKLYLNG